MQGRDAHNFDDVAKTVFCIPYESSEEGLPTQNLPLANADGRGDMENGEELRFKAYRDAWTKCLARMQKIVQELQAVSMKTVVNETKTSYQNVLTGLPYPELPVVSVINPTFGSTFLDQITSALEDDGASELSDIPSDVQCFVIHAYPGDFLNLSNGMRSIITGFVEKSGIEHVKPKTESLANYDIKFLTAWYKAWLETSELPQGSRPNLVVVLHHFEQYDPLVMRDVFHICSKYIPQLPLVFLLSMTSPLSNYLNAAYPQGTLALLRVRNFTTPTGFTILQEILLGTFFDVNFEPDIMIGPPALEYLHDYFMTYNPSVDAIFTIIQLIYLRHFSLEPLTVFGRNSPPDEVLSNEASFGFGFALCARVALVSQSQNVDMDAQHIERISAATGNIDRYRSEFYARYQNLRLGFSIMLCTQRFLEHSGHNNLKWFSSDMRNEGKLRDAMSNLLCGTLDRDVKALSTLTSKLEEEEARSLIGELNMLFFKMSIAISSQKQEQDARAKLAVMKSSKSTDTTAKSSSISVMLGEWLVDYLEQKLSSIEESALWEIWYTGYSPFPSELLNPSIRASMVSGLLRPHDYAEDPSLKLQTDPSSTKAIWELPDTSILFKRYLDSGKMINVYDWFESFKFVLDAQRSHLLEHSSGTPKKRGKGKAVKRQEVKTTEEEEEQWNVQVQARFIRAMHELDYLGFIKHTGRKADHLLRTVFDINDAE